MRPRGAALARAAVMAVATAGTRGMSYQRCGLGSLPPTWSTDAAVTTLGWPLSALRSDPIHVS